jgi:redox-sensitive bicupin YhaK (pirin superfamily)
MITIRKSEARGRFDHGWLDTAHTFSFGSYHDPRHMGFRSLRVLNEDRVRPGAGFGAHPHRNMEILTYVISGALSHEDSEGNRTTITPGILQRMTAGSGIVHSEMNRSRDEPVHFLQIWIEPSEVDLPPEYEEGDFAELLRSGALRLLASGDGRGGSLHIHQDADLYAARLPAGARLVHDLRTGRGAWLQVVDGALRVNGQALAAGDGAAAEAEERLALETGEATEIVLLDLA